MKALLFVCGLLVCSGVLSQALAQDSRSRDSALIRGNQEQPKVTYIVPWQPPVSPDLDVPEPEQKVEGVFKPIERDFYRQSLYFRRHLKLGVLPDNQ